MLQYKYGHWIFTRLLYLHPLYTKNMACIPSILSIEKKICKLSLFHTKQASECSNHDITCYTFHQKIWKFSWFFLNNRSILQQQIDYTKEFPHDIVYTCKVSLQIRTTFRRFLCSHAFIVSKEIFFVGRLLSALNSPCLKSWNWKWIRAFCVAFTVYLCDWFNNRTKYEK